MRQKEQGSHLRTEALERDFWARKRERLDVDVWADMRKGDIDAHRLHTPLWGNPARREHILSGRWSVPVNGGGAGTGTAKWDDDSTTFWDANTAKDRTAGLRT